MNWDYYQNQPPLEGLSRETMPHRQPGFSLMQGRNPCFDTKTSKFWQKPGCLRSMVSAKLAYVAITRISKIIPAKEIHYNPNTHLKTTVIMLTSILNRMNTAIWWLHWKFVSILSILYQIYLLVRRMKIWLKGIQEFIAIMRLLARWPGFGPLAAWFSRNNWLLNKLCLLQMGVQKMQRLSTFCDAIIELIVIHKNLWILLWIK